MEKRDLDKVKNSVRIEQAIAQYGVGAMVDFPEQTLVMAAPERWFTPEELNDERFAKALRVHHFGMPKKVAYARFPEWYFCPKCRRFKPLKEWIKQNKQVNRDSKDPDMIKKLICPTDKTPLTVARVVTVCEHGHLNDFPWIEWVHAMAKKQVCGNPALTISTGATSSEGLDSIVLRCACGATASLKNAFNKNIFQELEEKSGMHGFRCAGKHPFKNSEEDCSLYPTTMLRGSSSVYYPVVYTSLVIPSKVDKIRNSIINCEDYKYYVRNIDEEDTLEEKRALIDKKLSKWSQKINNVLGIKLADVEQILKMLFEELLAGEDGAEDPNSANYKYKEYEALTGIVEPGGGGIHDFSRQAMDVASYTTPYLKRVALIDKIRVTRALVGFSRIHPVNNMDSEGFVSIKAKSTNWYPAYEVRGEGIFIEFDDDAIQKWIKQNPEIVARANIIKHNYAETTIGKNNPRPITPKLIMLHTLSHVLINQLSFECGYSIASLSERIYCSDDPKTKMAGIFIYTASGDAEGTLGGLVRQGRADMLDKVFKKAIETARTCSNDPICITSRGQGKNSLNLAACYACGLLPETCCEEFNSFLDRAMLIGTYEQPEIGFWSSVK